MYGKLKGISSKLIRQFGAKCEVQTQQSGRYDPETGSVSKGKTETQSGYCLFDNAAFAFKANLPAGIEQGDVILYLTAECEPSLNSVVLANGEQWQLLSVQPLKPNGLTLLYQCAGRKING